MCVPRLRWSSPGRKARRGLDKKTRRVRDNVQPPVEAVKRLGKVRGAVVDTLKAAGGTCTLGELCEALRRSRPRDLRRRVLPMLVEAGIVKVEGDLVRLADDWEEALERERARKGEIRVERFYRTRYRQQREAFRNRHKVKPTQHWTNHPEADGAIEHLRRPDEPESEKPEPQKEPPRREEEAARARKVEELVRQGMKRRFALEEVCGQLGSGLRREPPPKRKPVAAERDWRSHPLTCECSACLYPEPRYARPYEGAAV